MKYLLLALTLGAGQMTFAANTGIDPTNLKLKVYKLAVSTSPLCTNLTTVINESAPDYMDFLANPTLGSGLLSNGTYPCIVIEMSDQVKYLPDETSDGGNCDSSIEETLDVCSSGSSVLVDGTTTTCSSGDNKVAMYLSTTSTSSGGSADAFNPPTTTNDATKGFNLGSALTVSGTSSAKFVVDGSGKVCDTNDGTCAGGGGGDCELAPPTFTFIQL